MSMSAWCSRRYALKGANCAGLLMPQGYRSVTSQRCKMANDLLDANGLSVLLLSWVFHHLFFCSRYPDSWMKYPILMVGRLPTNATNPA